MCVGLLIWVQFVRLKLVIMCPTRLVWRLGLSLTVCLFLALYVVTPHIYSARGYRGVLCATCWVKWGREGAHGCGPCPSAVVNALLIALGVVVILAVFTVFVATSVKSASSKRSRSSMMWKVLIAHLQVRCEMRIICLPYMQSVGCESSGKL